MKSLTLAISALFLSVGAAIAADAPPEVAVKTCLKHADACTDAKAGTATFDGNAEAKAFFATLNSTNRYAILFRIQTAKKAETRAKRIQEFIGMLERHEKLHP